MSSAPEKAVHVAQYIIKAYPKFMSAVKLQCLLYFAQKEALVTLGRPLFVEEIRAYARTPYVREVAEVFAGLRLDRAAGAWRWDALHMHVARHDRMRALYAVSVRHWAQVRAAQAGAS